MFMAICFVLQFPLHGQSKLTNNLRAMVNYHRGFNLPEYPFFLLVTEDNVQSIDVSLYKESRGKNIWEQLYNYPEYGMSLFYTSLGNDEILGREVALTYFFKFYFLNKNRFRLFNRLGIGLSYVNRKFDLEDNYLNVAIASNFNLHFNFRLGANYALTDKFQLNSGISFDHFSNANASEPNLGINSFTPFIGLCYAVGNRTEKNVIEVPTHIKKNHLELFLSIGNKHTRSLSSEYFWTSSLSFQLSREFTHVFRMGVGADIFYDSSVETQLEKLDEPYKNHFDFQTGIHLSQTVIFNRFSLTIQEGLYLFLVDHLNDYIIYNRGIIQYQINDRFSVRLAMKSNLHILDYPELGLGLKL